MSVTVGIANAGRDTRPVANILSSTFHNFTRARFMLCNTGNTRAKGKATPVGVRTVQVAVLSTVYLLYISDTVYPIDRSIDSHSDTVVDYHSSYSTALLAMTHELSHVHLRHTGEDTDASFYCS